MTQKLVFFGAGNMAQAIFTKLITKPKFEIEIINRNPDKLVNLKKTYPQLKISQTLDYQLSPNDILFIGVKPQDAKVACLAIQDKITNCQLVSIMAGITIDTLYNWTNNSRIIRVMPNIAAQISQGISALYSQSTLSPDMQQLISQIFSDPGMIYWAKNESEIDKIIPVSSSSLAFIYYFLEKLAASAEHQLGFDKHLAEQLIRQSAIGAIGLLATNSQFNAHQLRQQVTSKNGATEQGIKIFDKENLPQIIDEAMHSCYKRACEMADNFK